MSGGDRINEAYNVIFILGAPGSEKGTQCGLITSVKKYGFVHLSAGELLRKESDKPGSQYGEDIKRHIVNGTIVPVSVTCSLLKQAMDDSGKTNFLIDGFPRNQDNLDGWNDNMTSVASVKFVLFFKCPKEVCIQRILERSKSSGRTDDNIESLSKRFETFVTQTHPVIDYYRTKGMVREVDGHRSPDQIFADVQKLLVDFS